MQKFHKAQQKIVLINTKWFGNKNVILFVNTKDFVKNQCKLMF